MKRMTSRERVLAALNREPVDRIPYCEHALDPEVAIKSTGKTSKFAFGREMVKGLGLKGFLKAGKLFAAMKDSKSATEPGLFRELMYAFSEMDQISSTLAGKIISLFIAALPALPVACRICSILIKGTRA